MTIVVHSCPPTKGLVSFPSMMSVLPTAKGLITSQLQENTRQTCLRYHCDTGYSPGAPYDRIIATCAVPTIPPAWLKQAAPGAVILTDVHGPLGGTLARLTVDEHHTATGRFLAHWAGFMTMRHNVEPTPPQWPVLELLATTPPPLTQATRSRCHAASWRSAPQE